MLIQMMINKGLLYIYKLCCIFFVFFKGFAVIQLHLLLNQAPNIYQSVITFALGSLHLPFSLDTLTIETGGAY